MAYGWSRPARVTLFVAATGLPVALMIAAFTGWAQSALGIPTWLSWMVVILALLIGLPVAWATTPSGEAATTSALLKAYRREGLAGAEQRYLSKLAPHRAGLQLFNLGLALHRESDDDGAEAAYRRAAEKGFPPAMINLAHLLKQRGKDSEALELQRQAYEAGYKIDLEH